MKKHLGFIVFTVVLITIGHFYIKSHAGDEDMIRAKRTIQIENQNIEDAKKRH